MERGAHQMKSMSNQTSHRLLKILWQGSLPDLMIRHVELDGKPVERNTSFHKLLAVELEDLLNELFYKASTIVEPLTAGRSGTGVLKVQPFYPHQEAGQKV